ncbi:MAG: hypothetical protein HDQ93_03870 [Desulfovibrio sp.]|nr:hypothetical protein [Desulfovibrio sp.]
MLEKFPPVEKIAEAWSALASGRVKIDGSPDALSGTAEVVSSNGEKTYRLAWDGNVYESDDSATWWQGYPGYPVLALLMAQGKLPYDPRLGEYFKGINWNAANAKAKRNYAEALRSAIDSLDLSPQIVAEVDSEETKTMEALKSLDIAIRRYRKKRS